MQDFDDQHPRVRLIFSLVAILIVLGGLWLASSFIWPEDNGQIAILKADNTPFKTRPDDKGGMQIPHQDKLIFNTVSADGKPVTVERILPGPEQPLNAVQPNADPIVPAIPTVVNQAEQPVVETKVVEKAPEKAPEKAAEKPADKAPEKTPEKTTEKAAEKVAEKAPAKAPEKPVEKAAEKTTEKAAPLPSSNGKIDAPVAAMGRVVEAAAPAKPTNQPVKPPAAFDMSKGEPAPVKPPEPELVEKPVVEKAMPDKGQEEPAQQEIFVKEEEEPVVDTSGPKSKARIIEQKKAAAEDTQDPAEEEPAKKASEGKGHFQIASFFDRPSAEKALAQFKTKYADELDGAGLSIATATINGGKQVFRVQGSASSATVASSICSGIKAKGGSCVTIK